MIKLKISPNSLQCVKCNWTMVERNWYRRPDGMLEDCEVYMVCGNNDCDNSKRRFKFPVIKVEEF